METNTLHHHAGLAEFILAKSSPEPAHGTPADAGDWCRRRCAIPVFWFGLKERSRSGPDRRFQSTKPSAEASSPSARVPPPQLPHFSGNPVLVTHRFPRPRLEPSDQPRNCPTGACRPPASGHGRRENQGPAGAFTIDDVTRLRRVAGMAADGGVPGRSAPRTRGTPERSRRRSERAGRTRSPRAGPVPSGCCWWWRCHH